jgi:Protein of unknown function (DUF664)
MTSGGHPARIIPPFEADERATLTAFLDFQRATLALKCDGLTDRQLREQAVPPSSLSLLGIVRHMAEVERNWFRPVLGGEPMATIFAPDMDFEAAFRDVATAEVAGAFRSWHPNATTPGRWWPPRRRWTSGGSGGSGGAAGSPYAGCSRT